MLVIQVSKKNPKPTPAPFVNSYSSKTPSTLLVDEFKRRDSIIKDLVKTCPYRVGDVVQPASKHGSDKYGTNNTVTRMVTAYSQMGGTEEWPENNNPLIVEARDEDGVLFWCTTNYLKVKEQV